MFTCGRLIISEEMFSKALFIFLLVNIYYSERISSTNALQLSNLINRQRQSNGKGLTVKTGEDVVSLVSNVWDNVVANHQEGLLDPKSMRNGPISVSKDLTPKEALYHYRASQDGIVDSARFLVTFGVASSIAEMHSNPLLKAIAENDINQVRMVLDEGSIDVNDKSSDPSFESTPLHFAVSFENRNEIIAILIENGANVEVAARHGATALMIAASLNNVGAIKVLCDKGNAQIDAKHPFAKTTPLHFAAEMGHSDAIKELCSRLPKGKVNEMRTVTGGTPLHTAADSNRPAAVRALLEYCNADVDALLNGDTTPLYLAAQRGFHEVIRVLANFGANLDFVMPRDSEFSKAKSTSKYVVKLQDSANHRSIPYDYLNKNTELGNGATALHGACENGHLKAVDELLSLGASQLNTMEGSTPLVIALQYHHPHIAMRLLKDEKKSDPKVNAKTLRDGAFALFVASGNGYESVVDALLERNDILVNLRNNLNASSLSHAIYRKHLHIAKKLQKRGAMVDLASVQAALHVQADTIFVKELIYELSQYDGSSENMRAVLNHVLASTVGSSLEKEILQYLLTIRKVDVFEYDNNTGATPFHAACQSGNVLGVKLMLSGKKEFVDIRGRGQLSGATCLYLACSEGHLEVVRILLQLGANVSSGYILGFSVEDKKASENQIHPLFVAAEKGFLQIVDLLIKHGAVIDVPITLDPTSPGMLPVEVAANGGHENVVRRLINANTALVALNAAISNSKIVYPTVKAILDKQYIKDKHVYVLHLSKLLINQRETLTARPHDTVLPTIALLKSGWSQLSYQIAFPPLHAAVISYSDEENSSVGEQNALDFVKLLLNEDPLDFQIFEQVTVKSNMTALSLAIELERIKVVELLLWKTRSNHPLLFRMLERRNGMGESPLQQAQRLRNADLIKVLGKFVADVAQVRQEL